MGRPDLPVGGAGIQPLGMRTGWTLRRWVLQAAAA